MTVSELRTLVDNLDEYIHVPGGIDKLKKTVLHLAVTGQLVPQDSSEGTGDELYRHIQAERAELTKHGEHNKYKNLPDIMEEDVPYDIPENWRWVRLGNISDSNIGLTYSPSNVSSRGIAVLRSNNIQDGKMNYEDLVYVSSNVPESKMTHIGDLLICARNGSRRLVGKNAIIDKEGMCFGAFMALLRSEFNPFIKIFLDSPEFRRTLDGVQTTTINQITQGLLTNFKFPLPPVLEQKRIVAKVDSTFNLIDQLAETYETEQAERSKLVASSLAQLAKGEDGVEGSLALTHLSEIIRTKADAKILRQTILHLAVSGQIVPQDPSEGTGEDLYRQIQVEKQELINRGKLKKQKPLPMISEDEISFAIPNDWKWARLGDLSDIFNGNSINASEKKLKYEKVTEGYPYIATKDIGYGFESVDYENGIKVPFSEKKFKIISDGTALICSEGGSAGKKCGIVDRDVAFGNKMYAFKAFGGLILPEFVLYNYLSKQFYEQFSGEMTGIIGGISTSSFKKLLMPLPPLAEQKRIVAKTTQLLNLVTELEGHLVG